VPGADTKVLATYGAINGWLDGQAAIKMREHIGGGRVCQVGTWLATEACDALLGEIREAVYNKPVQIGSLQDHPATTCLCAFADSADQATR